MSEEKTQVFRGDEAPEMAIAETSAPVKPKAVATPADARRLQDQKNGPSDMRAIGGAADGAADQRRMDDADGLAELRQLHDAQGLSELRQMQDADGLSDQRAMQDADGLSDMRTMQDAAQAFNAPALNDGEGPSQRRELQDHNAAIPGMPANAATPSAGGTPQADATAASAPSDPDLTFKVEEDATPWALSIHLEERIANLGATNAKVNEQLNGLEDSIRRLAKRIGR